MLDIFNTFYKAKESTVRFFCFICEKETVWMFCKKQYFPTIRNFECLSCTSRSSAYITQIDQFTLNERRGVCFDYGGSHNELVFLTGYFLPDGMVLENHPFQLSICNSPFNLLQNYRVGKVIYKSGEFVKNLTKENFQNIPEMLLNEKLIE